MYYDKQIRYIDYLENGEKQRNCGYVKMTVTDNRLLLEMQIKGLYETDDVASEVTLEGAGAERRIGTILIRQGSGSFRWERKDPAHAGEELAISEGLCYGQLEQVHVQLSPRRSLRCVWREVFTRSESAKRRLEDTVQAYGTDEAEFVKRTVAQGSEKNDVVQEAAQGPAKSEQVSVTQPAGPIITSQGDGEKTDNFSRPDLNATQPVPEAAERDGEPQAYDLAVSVPKTGAIEERSTAGEAITENMAGKDTEKGNQIGEAEMDNSIMAEADITGSINHDDAKNAMEMAELHQDVGLGVNAKTKTASESRQAPRPPHMDSMSEDKWQQLQKIYPHIRPFQDEREYLSLRPEDFVILHSSAYQLVQNSFLLHGYFNYDHLILTQVSQRKGNQFYIGVPGNFYEKEKQVAIMYGFGSFECRQEPAQEGDFGYYMIKVDL